MINLSEDNVKSVKILLILANLGVNIFSWVIAFEIEFQALAIYDLLILILEKVAEHGYDSKS